jgi:hypothetical protein
MEFMSPEILAALFGGTASGLGVPTAAPPPVPAMPDPALIGSSLNPASPAYPTMNPSPAPPAEPYRSEPMQGGAASAASVPSLGQSLEPVPMPRPRPAEAPAATDMSGTAKAPTAGDALLKTLQGVKAPAPPVPQKVSTPHAPSLRPIQGGEYGALLASLGVGPQQAFPGLKLPSTLGMALGGR